MALAEKGLLHLDNTINEILQNFKLLVYVIPINYNINSGGYDG